MMVKKINKYQTSSAKNNSESSKDKSFYFGSQNFKLMLLGLGLIVLGFVLMLGSDANTKPDGVYDPNYWNEDIFSFRRIRLAPLFVISGFVVQILAILNRNK